MLDELIQKIIEETVLLTLKKAGALQQTVQSIPEIMNPTQLAEYLGMSESWVYQHTKELPHEKRGRKTLFIKTEIDEWREQQRALKEEGKPKVVVHVNSASLGKKTRGCYKVV